MGLILNEIIFAMTLYMVFHREIGQKNSREDGWSTLGIREMKVVLNVGNI